VFDSRQMHDIFTLQNFQTGVGVHTASYSLGVKGFFLQVKSGRSVSCTTHSDLVTSRMNGELSTVTLCLHGVYMENFTFAFYGSIQLQRKVTWSNNTASEDHPDSQTCVTNLGPGGAVNWITVGERIFSIPHRVCAGCGVHITFFQ
jgi:hypothetical protein